MRAALARVSCLSLSRIGERTRVRASDLNVATKKRPLIEMKSGQRLVPLLVGGRVAKWKGAGSSPLLGWETRPSRTDTRARRERRRSSGQVRFVERVWARCPLPTMIPADLTQRTRRSSSRCVPLSPRGQLSPTAPLSRISAEWSAEAAAERAGWTHPESQDVVPRRLRVFVCAKRTREHRARLNRGKDPRWISKKGYAIFEAACSGAVLLADTRKFITPSSLQAANYLSCACPRRPDRAGVSSSAARDERPWM